MGSAFVIAAASGAVMSWDGSYQFFAIVDSQDLFVGHNRMIGALPQIAVLILNRLAMDFSALQIAYGLFYVAIPFGALIASWWIVREIVPAMFVWVGFGLGVGTLVGQFFLVSEASIAIQLFWPITMGILTGLQRRHIPIVIALTIILFFTHPFSIILYALAAALALMIGQRDTGHRRRMRLWALGFIVLSVLAALRFTMTKSSYESAQFSLDVMIETFDASLAGFPLIALTFGWLAALLTFVAPLAKRSKRLDLSPGLHVDGFICVITAGFFLLIWAGDAYLWRSALDYRYWVLFASLPFFLLAALEGRRGNQYSHFLMGAEWFHRQRILLLISVTFLLVLSAQSMSWVNLTRRLRQSIAQVPNICIKTGSIEWINESAFNHWSITPYSLAIQGRTPTKVILEGDHCSGEGFTEGIRIAEWHWRSWDDGWFDTGNLAQGLALEQEMSR